MNEEIVKEVLTGLYQDGFDDGYGTLYNDEYVGEDKSKTMEVVGVETAVNDALELLKKLI